MIVSATSFAAPPSRESRPRLGHVPVLDGIRGVAVLLVFLYHLGVPGFASGYMGVDVFFVLSGFLITSLLLEEMDRRGKISLPGFWARRVRRLIPPPVFMLLVGGAGTP